MSLDKREDILACIFSIMQTVSGIRTVARNLDEMPEQIRPCLTLIDGDETRSDTSRGINTQPLMMVMSPLIAIGVSSSPENLGPDLNAIRAQLLPSILGDSGLADIIRGGGGGGRSNGRIIYEGLNSRFTQGSLMAGDVQLNFSIFYPLIIETLA